MAVADDQLEAAAKLTDHERVVLHRMTELAGLGFSVEQIQRMGVARHLFDWHVARHLLNEGKTHEQVTWLLEED